MGANSSRLMLVGSRPADEVESLLEEQATLQQRVFVRRGVIVPLIEYQQTEEMGADGVELRLDGRAIGAYSWSSFDADEALGNTASLDVIAPELEANAASFVVPSLVEHYLVKSSDAYPTLGRAVRAAFTVPSLTDQLATRVSSGGSIRDLRSILESLLQAR